MAEAHPSLPTLPRRGFGETSRPDAWWIQPCLVFAGLSAFIVYSTWAAFQAKHYRFGPYLSPFYSPEFAKPAIWPRWLPFSPALLILWAPAGFRLTCYYYRGAYYKAFWADPPSCAVGETRRRYLGEASFPLILQNAHRYFLYLALVFLCILSYDVLLALRFADLETGEMRWGVGVGTVVLALNVVFLGGYTLGCHSLRHLVGGRVDRVSESPSRRAAYSCATCLNQRHMLFAWTSLFWVGFSDLYVRLCAMGVWSDLRVLF